MTRQQKITFGEMRASGASRIIVHCGDYKCGHSVTMYPALWPDNVRLSDLVSDGEVVSADRGTDMTNPDFKVADAAIEEAALVFVEKIVELFGKWEGVRPSYILLLELSELLSPVGDHLKPALGQATHKLLDAFADYRDSRPEDR